MLYEFAHYYVTYFYLVNNSFINQHNRFICWFQIVYSISEQKDKIKDLESKIELLQNQVNESNNVNREQLDKMKD